MGAAGTAGMKIKLSGQSALASCREALRACLRFLLQALTWVFLPHMLLGAVIFVTVGISAYQTGQHWLANAPILLGLWAGIIFLMCGSFAFVYALLTAGLFALRSASERVEDLLYGLFGAVKERIAAKIDNMDEGLAKDQAKLLLTSSLAEVIAELKKSNLRSVAALAANVFLGLVSFAAKSVLIKRVMDFSSTTVSMGSVFASRVTLAGAIFLNMSLICTVLLWFLYFVGALLFGGSMWFVFTGE